MQFGSLGDLFEMRSQKAASSLARMDQDEAALDVQIRVKKHRVDEIATKKYASSFLNEWRLRTRPQNALSVFITVHLNIMSSTSTIVPVN